LSRPCGCVDREGDCMSIQKLEKKYRESNLDSAKRILQDPAYQEGSLMKLWAVEYLRKHAAEAQRANHERH